MEYQALVIAEITMQKMLEDQQEEERLSYILETIGHSSGSSKKSSSSKESTSSGGTAGTKEGGEEQSREGDGRNCKKCPVGPFTDGDNSALESNGLFVNFINPEDHDTYRKLASKLKGKVGKDKVVVLSHGTGVRLEDDRDGVPENMNAERVQEVLITDYLGYSKMMKQNKSGTRIFLLGCNTASVTKELSRHGMTVVGTTGFLFLSVTDGNQISLSGVSSTDQQNLNDRGWVTYQNGKQVGLITPGNYYYNTDKFR